MQVAAFYGGLALEHAALHVEPAVGRAAVEADFSRARIDAADDGRVLVSVLVLAEDIDIHALGEVVDACVNGID